MRLTTKAHSGRLNIMSDDALDTSHVAHEHTVVPGVVVCLAPLISSERRGNLVPATVHFLESEKSVLE